MDLSVLSNLKEVGIAIVAVVGAGFLIKYIIDKNKEVFDALIIQLQQNRKDYSEFVESNNHANSERIEKSTEAMVNVARAIEQHTKVVERLLDKN